MDWRSKVFYCQIGSLLHKTIGIECQQTQNYSCPRLNGRAGSWLKHL